MPYSVCIDIGGTFTDAIVLDPTGGLRIFKVPTTPPRFEEGFMAALALAADAFGLELRQFLADTDMIVHGTTISTNALVEQKVGRCGLLVTAGHPDILLLREGPRKRTFDWAVDYPDPLVPAYLTREIGGRIDAKGNEIAPLNADDVRAAVELFKQLGVDAIAISFLWSIVNGSHERAAREIIAEAWPEVPVTLGHELNPIQREYRRTVATAINASLQPVMQSYVTALEAALRTAGYGAELLIANCEGGMQPARDIIDRPILSVMSGPTLAPIAAKKLSREGNLIVADMGGTTFDISAVRDGQLIVSQEARIGYDLLGIPKVDVRSIGAGGGSIAWVDDGGLLRVGPRSASAVPGPACYGRGGTEPTVTDANVVLGIIDPDNFLGGRMTLDRAAAERAVGGIAERLGIDLRQAAHAIYTACNHNMVGAIEDITVNEGIDPRDSLLVSGGGATGCHIAAMARVLGIRRFLVPRLTSGLSAFGGLVAPLRFNVATTRMTDSRAFDLEAINAVLADLTERAAAELSGARTPLSSRTFEYAFLARYRYQSWEIEVPFSCPAGGLRNEDVEALVAAFHEMHERLYAFNEPTDIVEFTTWKVAAVGKNKLTDVDFEVRPWAQKDWGRPPRSRDVYLHDHGGLTPVPVFQGQDLEPGSIVTGPAIVEEDTTTFLLLPDMVSQTRANGDYLVAVGTEAPALRVVHRRAAAGGSFR